MSDKAQFITFIIVALSATIMMAIGYNHHHDWLSGLGLNIIIFCLGYAVAKILNPKGG